MAADFTGMISLHPIFLTLNPIRANCICPVLNLPTLGQPFKQLISTAKASNLPFLKLSHKPVVSKFLLQNGCHEPFRENNFIFEQKVVMNLESDSANQDFWNVLYLGEDRQIGIVDWETRRISGEVEFMRSLLVTLTLVFLFVVPFAFSEETIEATLEWRNEEKINHDYLIFLPSDYGEEKEKQWPLIVYLHGGGGTTQIVKNHLRAHRKRPFIFLAPICPPVPQGVAGHYKNWDSRMVGAIVKKVVADYSIDQKRCTLMGFSMGGSGAWALPFYHPELFDRVIVMSGSCHPWKLRHFPKIPVRVYSGEKESWLTQHTNTVRTARSFGVDVTHTIWSGTGHGACRQQTMQDDELWDWISKPLNPASGELSP